MEFIFAQKEKVLGRYPFVKEVKTSSGKRKETNEVVTYEEEIVVTDKRLIYGKYDKGVVERQDFDVKEIAGVKTKYIYEDQTFDTDKYKGRLKVTFGVIFLILALAGLGYVGYFLYQKNFDFTVLLNCPWPVYAAGGAGVLLLLIGIIKICRGARILKAKTEHNKKCGVELAFYGVNKMENLLNVNAAAESKEITKKHLKKVVEDKEKSILKVTLNLETSEAQKLAACVGANLVDAKSN